jgi:GMP synthase (glutamine-hydrolysing)
MPVEDLLAKEPAAIILSGGPASVYAPGAPTVDAALFAAPVPVLGICYGFQAMTEALGGSVKRTDRAEFGRTRATTEADSVLFGGLPQQQEVWMSHRDAVVEAPAGFRVTASTDDLEIAAFEDVDRGLYGLQWHPEVGHTTYGQDTLSRFLHGAAGLGREWSTRNIVDDAVARVREQVGDGHVICGLSGGVDSAVAAAIVHEAVGDQLTCVFVDHGLLRKDEREQVETDFRKATGVRLEVVDARARFLSALEGQTDPEEKRKIIGRTFIETFEDACRKIVSEDAGEIQFLVQGTLYPDVVESGGGVGTANIKSHHNVGGLPADLRFRLIEPLRTLFKDEVRAIGTQLGLPPAIVNRHPFPGPGLAIRIVGAVTDRNLAIVREADAIVRQEMEAADLDATIWQCPVVLLADVRSVGVQGDGRTYGHPIVLRPVTSEDAMTADWARLPYELLERISTRITNDVEDVNRVVLDLTSKPPGTIEWE